MYREYISDSVLFGLTSRKSENIIWKVIYYMARKKLQLPLDWKSCLSQYRYRNEKRDRDWNLKI